MSALRHALLAMAGNVIALTARLVAVLTHTRVRRAGRHPDGPVILAFRHGDQLALLPYPRPRPTAAVVSRSEDGALQAQVLTRLGLHVIRGSTSRGGAEALASSLRWLQKGGDLALAVDGPRGPSGRAKPGVIWLSERARAPIVAVSCSLSASCRLERSWDRFQIPLPLSLVQIASAPAFRPWEEDWTRERKLAHLDSLVEQMEASARVAIARLGGLHGRSGEHRREDR